MPADNAKASTVGQITGMVDCSWEGSELRVQGSDENGHKDLKSEIRNLKSPVSLGDRFAIRSGLLEITYDTGAKVILQGPVTYKVESKNGGFMSVGKLTGKVEVEAAKGFCVRTPTATVTDLGTEFGVEVDREGNHDVQVFAGQVKVQLPAEQGGRPREMQLTVNQAIRFNASTGSVTRHSATTSQFVRNISPHTASQSSRSIGVNFTCGDKTNLSPEEITGVVPAANWNNVDGDPMPTSTIRLRDATGEQTRSTLTWQWRSDGALPQARTCPTYLGGMTPRYPFEKLFDGRFKRRCRGGLQRRRCRPHPESSHSGFVDNRRSRRPLCTFSGVRLLYDPAAMQRNWRCDQSHVRPFRQRKQTANRQPAANVAQ